MKKFLAILCAVIALAVILAPVAQATNYAVLFSGGFNKYSNYDRYYTNTLRMWNIMTGPLGFDVANVYVLAADGTDPGDDQRTGPGSYISSDWSAITSAGGNIYAGTGGNLETTLDDLGDVITTDDCFYFWSFDHGSGSTSPPPPGDDTSLTGWGDSISDDDFGNWIDTYIRDSGAPMGEAYFFGQCFSGGMVDDLNIHSGTNRRFAAWAANWDEPSYGDGWVAALADGIDTGLRYTWDLGNYAMINDPYYPTTEHPGWTGDNFHIITNQPIPEPSTFLLIGSGLMGLAAFRRKRFNKK